MALKHKASYIIIALFICLIEIGIATQFKSGFIRHTFGDFLASILVYCSIKGLTNATSKTAVILTICIAFGIEFLQLTSLLEILNLQNNALAKTLLGSTFSISDLIAYSLGVLAVFTVEQKELSVLILNNTLKKLKLKHVIILGITSVLVLVFISNLIVAKTAENKTYFKITDIPKNKVGILLGVSKFTSKGTINLYYQYRLNAAVKLFKAGKIDFILVSGDNGSKTYDEPTTFKNDLIALGIPATHIFLDYAGFRTLDSMVRARDIFGQTSITVISQRFHNQRAIYLAENHDIKAVGYNAKHTIRKGFFNKPIREYVARTKAFLDIIFNTQPKFLGKKIKI